LALAVEKVIPIVIRLTSFCHPECLWG